jgi:DNA-binding NarL/FixJ family response regulator
MAGGTLMAARTVYLHPHYKKLLEDFRFPAVAMTALDRDGLCYLIREMNPDIFIIEARFEELTTPYKMRELVKEFPELYTAAYSFEYYSVEHAMYFISNGVKAYVTGSDGPEEYNRGMRLIRNKMAYVAPSVTARISLRGAQPKEAKILSDREKEIAKLTCYGWSEEHIADSLNIARSTVIAHKANMFRSLNVRNYSDLS